MLRNVARFAFTGNRIVTPLLLLLLAGCGDVASYNDAAADQRPPVKVGEVINIKLRRDALGAVGAGPTTPFADVVGNERISLDGKVAEVRPGWILIDIEANSNGLNGSGASQCWVPLSSILMIQRFNAS